MENKRLIILIAFLLGCENIVYRMDNDYFPLKTTNKWEYEDSKANLRIIEVVGDSTVQGLPSKIVENNFKPEFWYKTKERVRKFIVKTINIDGEDDTLEQIYRTYYLLPFIKGDSWESNFGETLEVYGDSIFFTHRIEGKVLDIEDSVSVPAGTFYEVYKLRIKETFTLNDSTWIDSVYEWYAPGIGLIKREDSTQEVLKSYYIK